MKHLVVPGDVRQGDEIRKRLDRTKRQLFCEYRLMLGIGAFNPLQSLIQLTGKGVGAGNLERHRPRLRIAGLTSPIAPDDLVRSEAAAGREIHDVKLDGIISDAWLGGRDSDRTSVLASAADSLAAFARLP